MSHLWTFWSGFSIVLHSWCTKWYVTYFTFEIFVAFMNWVECLFRCWTWVNDLQQDSHLWSLWPPWTLYMCFVKDPARKWFATRFTIVIYMSFMNYVYVLHQIISCRKLFTTGFTLWSLWSVGMCLFKLSAWKMLYCKTYICDLFYLYDFFGCASSNLLPQKMIYYKKDICGLCSLHELNCVDMCNQSYCRSKWFVTRFTYVFFVVFMNCVVVSLQIFCFRKGFTTRFTLGIFLAFMNWC